MRYLFGLLVFCCAIQVHAGKLHIAAATNLRFVLPEIIESFEAHTAHQIAVSYAASGTLTTQIQHGAPFELFFSASPDYIQRLIDDELTQGKVFNYAQAQLALFASNNSNLLLDIELKGLKQALEAGSLNKIAIANPQHAPYGQAARTVLKKIGIWQQVQAHLLMAENASQVMQFSLSTTVDAGFVPYSFIIQPQFSSLGHFIKLNITLQQQVISLHKASKISQQFLDFIKTPEVQTIFTKHGFLVAAES